MKSLRKQINKLYKLARRNYFIIIFVGIIFLVGIVIIFKYITAKPTYFYAKVQVSYPASYFSKPDFWLVKSLETDSKQYNILGQSEAELLGMRYYPSGDGTSYNIYLTVKLSGNYDKKTQEYTFQRSQIGVGSPITLNFSSSQLYGTVIDLNAAPFKDKYIAKTITLVDRGAYYKDDPTFYNSINVGDKYFDGKDYIFEVVNKDLQENIFAVTNILTGQVTEGQTDTTQNIIIKAKVLVLEKDNRLIFAGNQTLTTGSKFIFSTGNFSFNDFIITAIN